MPWKVVKQDKKFCVFKLDAESNPTGEALACHDTDDKAQAQMRALYANEPEAGKATPVDELTKAGARHRRTDRELLKAIHAGARRIAEAAIEMGFTEEAVAEALAEGAQEAAEDKAFDSRLVVKSLGQHRLGGYLAIWGTPKAKDLTNEYFTPKTHGMTKVFESVGRVPLLYQHGTDEAVQFEIVGTYDVMQPDEVGLWAEMQLDKASKYRVAIRQLVAKGALGQSSQSLASARKVAKDGHIDHWVIVEGSLTPTPCEPRMVDRPVAEIKAAYKALSLTFPEPSDGEAIGGEEPRHDDDALALERERIALLDL